MEFNGLMGGLYRLCEWIMRLAYLNLLWIGFSLLGLILFGLGPATAAIYAVQRKWKLGEMDVPIFKTFWSTYKKEFLQANILAIIFMVLGYILYTDLQFIAVLNGAVQIVFYVATLILLFLYFVTLAYLFPVFVHYDLKNVGQYMKNALLIGISQFPYAILMLIGAALLYILFRFLPGLLPFFGVSLLSLIITWCAHWAFNRVHRKLEGGEESSTSSNQKIQNGQEEVEL